MDALYHHFVFTNKAIYKKKFLGHSYNGWCKLCHFAMSKIRCFVMSVDTLKEYDDQHSPSCEKADAHNMINSRLANAGGGFRVCFSYLYFIFQFRETSTFICVGSCKAIAYLLYIFYKLILIISLGLLAEKGAYAQNRNFHSNCVGGLKRS